jgi:hypothetical protein
MLSNHPLTIIGLVRLKTRPNELLGYIINLGAGLVVLKQILAELGGVFLRAHPQATGFRPSPVETLLRGQMRLYRGENNTKKMDPVVEGLSSLRETGLR